MRMCVFIFNMQLVAPCDIYLFSCRAAAKTGLVKIMWHFIRFFFFIVASSSSSSSSHIAFAQLYVVREGDPLEQRFFAAFIEDKNRNQAVSYYEFLQTLQREISKAVSNAPK